MKKENKADIFAVLEEIMHRIPELSEKCGLKGIGVGMNEDEDINIEMAGDNIKFTTGLLKALSKQPNKPDIIDGLVAHELGHKVKHGGGKQFLNNRPVMLRLALHAVVEGVIKVCKAIIHKGDVSGGLRDIAFGDKLIQDIDPMARSRVKEYEADEFAARLVGKSKVIAGHNFIMSASKELLAEHPEYLSESSEKFYKTAMYKVDGILKNDKGVSDLINKMVTSLYQLGRDHPLYKNRIKALERLKIINVTQEPDKSSSKEI